MNTTKVDENQFDGGLNEILHGAFVGLYMCNEDGVFVSLDDKYNVLKDHFRKEVTALLENEVAKARLDELGSLLAGHFTIERVYSRMDNLNKQLADTESNKEGVEVNE